ncbi:hypothetical protein VTK73DRAFT_4352 [Phialemonium thermophilum]|uniref:Uncharacterized protein n=1 Tax=Phialemonium thermophilum TaxID=223376 RepID=A0ABR3WTX5_9PEZI
MTICTYVLANYVPAVAAIRKRLVLFIINRFKGYSDGRTIGVEIIFGNTSRTGKGEGNLLLKTDVEGRRHRSQKGLGTLVVCADNSECYRLDIIIIWSINENVSISPQE